VSTPENNPLPSHVPAEAQPDDAMLKIREILVGPTTRAIEDRLDALEKHLRSGLENQRIQSAAVLEQAQRNFESKLEDLRKLTGASHERISKAQAETREWIEHEIESIRAGLDHTFASVRAEFVDRQSMASLFSEMALRVSSESGAPMDSSLPDDDFEVVLDQRKKT
jgi:hypothetical protein